MKLAEVFNPESSPKFQSKNTMNRTKCNQCGLVNSSSDLNCRRCGINLRSSENAPPRYSPPLPIENAETKSSNPFPFIIIIGVLLFAAIYGYSYYINSQLKEEEDARIAEKNRLEFERKLHPPKEEEIYMNGTRLHH